MYTFKQMISIGFDLDMTLIDSSRSIKNSLIKVLFDEDIEFQSDLIDKSIGLPVKELLKKWVGDSHARAYNNYKETYQTLGYKSSECLPGAVELLNQLFNQGYNVYIITAKNHKSAKIQLDYFNFKYTDIFGEVFGLEKSKVMKQTNCVEYVGDHIEDFKAASECGINFLGVSSNPHHNLKQYSGGRFPIMNTLNEFWDYSTIKVN